MRARLLGAFAARGVADRIARMPGDRSSGAGRKVRATLRSTRARDAAFKVADKLPPRLRGAFLRTARGARDLLTVPMDRPKTASAAKDAAPPPKRYRVSPAPKPITTEWPEPPFVETPGAPIRSVYEQEGAAPKYDIDLLLELNREYESKPIVPKPQGEAAKPRVDRAHRRLVMIHEAIDLGAGKRVLEIGCGAGYEVWFLAHHFGAEAFGVDVVERKAWATLSDDAVHYECADITQKNPFPPDTFDRVISFSVWEHVHHPYKALEETFKMMKPGGLAWISANLYRSQVGSHLYRDLYFPWPHLLFTDDVIKEFYRRRGETERGSSWVNKLTWDQYERSFNQVGFKIKMLRFSEREIDEEFYKRFEDILGRYPRWDLTKDFFNVVVEKPAR